MRGDDGSAVDGKGAPVVPGLNEDNDGAQRDEADMMAKWEAKACTGMTRNARRSRLRRAVVVVIHVLLEPVHKEKSKHVREVREDTGR